MKKGLFILLALIIASSVCAFTKGTINPGGTVSFTSFKPNSDEKAITMFSITPQVGYFIIDDFSADVLLNYMYEGQNGDEHESEYSTSLLGIGIGGRYFYPVEPGKIYGGMDFLYNSFSWEDEYDGEKYDGNRNAMYLDLKAGYLFPVVENVYVDFGLKYQMGLGDYGGDDYEDALDEYKENEESSFGINIGLQIFIPTLLY